MLRQECHADKTNIQWREPKVNSLSAKFDLCDSSMNPEVASAFFVERQHAAFNTSTAVMATFDKMQEGYGADVVEEVAAHALGFALKGHGL